MHKTTTTYAQLNIGRNVGDSPMSDAAWDAFIRSARMRLAYATLDIDGRAACGPDHIIDIALNHTELHTGTGTWQGVTEDSARVSIFWHNGVDVDLLERMAGTLARDFEQDSIAVVTGSTLATPPARE